MDEAREAKRQFQDNNPKRIKALKFGLLSSADILSQSVAWLTDRNLYDTYAPLGPRNARTVVKNGPLDLRLGTSNNSVKCETCDQQLKNCNGHFGHVKLALPVFHVGFMKNIVEILHCICKECSELLLPEAQKRQLLKTIRRPNLDNPQREAIFKKVIAECKKCRSCSRCGSVNGIVKKVAGHALKVVHDKYNYYNRSAAKSRVPPPSLIQFEKSFDFAKKSDKDVEKHFRKAMDDLNPLRVLDLFERVRNDSCELLGLGPDGARPEMLLWQCIPAPPVGIRPSVQQETASTEDDITNKLGDIIQINGIIEAGLKKGQPIQTIMEQWDYMQVQVAMYISSDTPGLAAAGNFKKIRAFCQRLKGKQGRFRGNLSGKRVDFSSRTVISPDPNLSINEIAVPQRIASHMTYPERVTHENKAKLQRLVRKGTRYPGANFIHKSENGRKIVLAVFTRSKNQAKLDSEAERLQMGDIVDRHLEDGDIVLFNRQPSLHKLSVMCHRIQVKEWRTFRLNECVCTPYNADFDGDEMNMHVPQTEEARAEALELMGVKHNIATPKDGTPIIAATQDFITCTYLLSNKDKFYSRKAFAQICNYMFDANVVTDGIAKVYNQEASAILKQKHGIDLDLPEPAILKPEALWTGKQVFNVLMRPSKKSNVLVNFDAKCKEYKDDPKYPLELNEDDTYVCIRNSEVMSGIMDKAILGGGKKDSIFYVMMRDYGPEFAVDAMNRMAKLSARWLTNEGFSIGITDVQAGKELREKKTALVTDAYQEADKIIRAYKDGKLGRDAGCDQAQTMENRITGKLNEVRAAAGKLCMDLLSQRNAALVMAKSGSKGSNINVAQMVSVVGQQAIGQARVANGFQDRTLPHFPKHAPQPPSKGFVSNSFYTGLSPTEFIFHAMSGREGLVDTAVKTAETGYMSRRLVKSLEDLSVSYDDSVRNSVSNIVQFQFGDDSLDPLDMEGKAKPVDFARSFLHAQQSKYDSGDPCLSPSQIKKLTHNLLEPERAKLERVSLDGRILGYRIPDGNHVEVDHKESHRRFLDETEDFLHSKADALAGLRQHLGLSSGLDEVKGDFGGPQEQDRKQEILATTSSYKVSDRVLRAFIGLCLTKYHKAKVEPGHAVGCVGAQSIGEPGTQMTLKTFHFAGVAGMSITQGVPRIKEIINASSNISTPVIVCQLENPISEDAARFVKGQIEKTYLRDIIQWISECWTEQRAYLRLAIDMNTITDLALDVSIKDIRNAIIILRGWKFTNDDVKISERGAFIDVHLPELDGKKGKAVTAATKTQQDAESENFIRLQALKRALPSVVIKGYTGTARAVIARKQNQQPTASPTNPHALPENEILVEGYGLKQCMTTPGVRGSATTTNNVMEARAVLGIEAARRTIISELDAVMGSQMGIDPRHMQLLADVMTYKGDVLGITRFGLAKMRDSVLQLASFEKTSDHLFEAARAGKEDGIQGVSECIIMGQSMSVGTGAMGVVRDMKWKDVDLGRKATGFEDAWASVYG